MTTPEILLVDDNVVQATTRQMILTRAGFYVQVADQAAEALLLAGRPDLRKTLRLVITDHLMPQMNGPEFVSRIRELLPAIPVLVLSGLPGAEREYEALGVAFHLKPFPPEELIRLVRSLLSGPALRSA